MSKLTRKQKKEEEQRILNEMREALREAEEADGAEESAPAEPSDGRTGEPTVTARRPRFYDPTPEQIHCKRCKTLMENGVCPTCGFRIYVPMDEKKKGKIKFILTCVFMAILVAVVVIMQIAKS